MNKFTDIVKRKFTAALDSLNTVSDADNIIVGFSGGADSVCLLHLLSGSREEKKIKVYAAHINHGIRGEEAERDALFCKNFCEKLSVPFYLLEANCPEEAEKTGESLEECGRRLRYAFFDSLCTEKSLVATAHNANDNVETIIFNMSRGSSVRGVCGIPFCRGNIIRPLLYCSRQEIEGYCQENSLSFVTDSTNLSDDYTRNKIRHNILPVIGELNPSFTDSFSRLSGSASEIVSFLDKCSDDLKKRALHDNGRFSVELLKKSDVAVLKHFLVKEFETRFSKNIEAKKVYELLKLLSDGGRIQLYGNIYAEVNLRTDSFRFYSLVDGERVNLSVSSVPFSYDDGIVNIFINSNDKSLKNIKNYVLDNLVDCDKIKGNLVVRTRCEGDSFSPRKRGLSKSLKKLFNEAGVGIELRDYIPIVCDDNGIVWVMGFGVGADYCVDDNTLNTLEIGGFMYEN